MAFWEKKTVTNRTLQDLSDDERTEIEEAIYAGDVTVADLSRQYGVRLGTLYQLRRQLGLTPNQNRNPAPVSSRSAAVQQIREETEILRAQMERDRVESDLMHAREMAKLELERKRLEIEQMRRELYDDFADDDITDENGDLQPEKALYGIIMQALKNGGIKPINAAAASPPTSPAQGIAPNPDAIPPPPSFDLTQPLDDTDLKTLLEMRFTADELRQAATTPWVFLEPQIKQHVPNIHAENLNSIKRIIGHYGQS